VASFRFVVSFQLAAARHTLAALLFVGRYLLGAAVMITTLLLKDLSAIAKLSVVGVASSVVLIGVVVGVGMVQPAGEGSWKHPEKTESFTSGRRSLLSIGLVMVGFAGHACFPTLRTSMKSLEDCICPNPLLLVFHLSPFHWLLVARSF